MIIKYIEAALRKAHYEFVEDGKCFFGSVHGLKGVWAEGATLEECPETLAEVIEDWVWAHIRDGVEVPKVDGIVREYLNGDQIECSGGVGNSYIKP